MQIVRRFAFTVFCVFYLAACNFTKTIPFKTLGDAYAGGTSRFVFRLPVQVPKPISADLQASARFRL